MKRIENRKILGMLTPSSNTVLEPMTHDILAELDDVSAHFARFRVTEITLSEYGLGQFDMAPFLDAAGLLGDAKCDVIAWNGTSGGWRGFAYDAEICAQIAATTGAGATTSILANNDLFRRHGVSRFGLVTPYTDDVQAKILANYAADGFTCVAESHLKISDNFAFSRSTTKPSSMVAGASPPPNQRRFRSFAPICAAPIWPTNWKRNWASQFMTRSPSWSCAPSNWPVSTRPAYGAGDGFFQCPWGTPNEQF